MQSIVDISANFMGHDANLCVTYEVTDFGAPPIFDPVYGGEPGYGPEWEVLSIGVTLSLDDGDGAEWHPEYGSAEYHVLANLPRVDDAILNDIQEMDIPTRRYRKRWIAA